jgi:hypothetical protein
MFAAKLDVAAGLLIDHAPWLQFPTTIITIHIITIKMSTTIENSLMKFDAGLKLYMQRDGKKLTGITLRKESSPSYDEAIWKEMGWTRCFWPVFDIASDALPVSQARKSIVYQHLDNFFNRRLLGQACNLDPNILTHLFVAEGTSAGMSLQALLDLGDIACTLAGSPVSEPSNSSASNSSASNSSSAPAPAPVSRPYTYVLDDELDEAYSVEAQRSFTHGLDVYVQMSKSQPQQGGITLLQTPEGIRFRQSTHNGWNQLTSTATQLIIHYKRTMCDAPFNFHPLYYIFVERGRYAKKSLAQIIIGRMVPGLAGKQTDVSETYEATWPTVPTATAVATPVIVEEMTPVVATAEPEDVLDRLRAKYSVLAEEHKTLILIEAQLELNEQLKDEIAYKRKILEHPECK